MKIQEKYAIYSSDGEEYVQMILDSVYSQTINGEEKYYMIFTMPGEGTRLTYDVDEYFKQYVTTYITRGKRK